MEGSERNFPEQDLQGNHWHPTWNTQEAPAEQIPNTIQCHITTCYQSWSSYWPTGDNKPEPGPPCVCRHSESLRKKSDHCMVKTVISFFIRTF